MSDWYAGSELLRRNGETNRCANQWLHSDWRSPLLKEHQQRFP